MNRKNALMLAESIVTALQPYAEKIVVAGSLRRGLETVKDIDIVLLAKAELQHDLFGGIQPVAYRIDNFDFSKLGAVLTGGGRLARQVRLERQGVGIDISIVRPPAQYGYILAIRTGPREFSHWMVTAKRYGGAMPEGLWGEDGAIQSSNGIVDTPEEIDVFDVLGIPYLEPQARGPYVTAIKRTTRGIYA